ncbi:hypothetical protein MiSe_48590 [Microseira wollei NIES-4236]|uniref:Transposase n=1 Tax=Microseira wollei NIES-4236 TaxID=2530354 RepID=A0AAV3XF40_9CYAN|nr:hypothetical protein MiSe_48590 [Microseira wollei NIES-4236]
MVISWLAIHAHHLVINETRKTLESKEGKEDKGGSSLPPTTDHRTQEQLIADY